MKAYENFIEGKFVRGSDEGRTIPVFNPSTEEEIAHVPESSGAEIDRSIEAASRSDYGLTSSIYTSNIDVAMRACKEIQFGETYINRENFEAMQSFHAGWRKSGLGGADGKHGLYEYTQTHVVYLQFKADVK